MDYHGNGMNPKLPFQCSCLADSYKLQPQKPLQFGFPGKALHWPLATAFALTPASLELAEACSCGFRNSPDTNGSWGWTLVVIQWQRNYTATICNIPFISFYILLYSVMWVHRFSEGAAKMRYLGINSAVRSSWVPLLCRSLRKSSWHGPTDTVHRLPKRRLT